MSRWLLLVVLLSIMGCSDGTLSKWITDCEHKGGIAVQVRGVKGTHHWMCVKEVL